MKPITKRQIKKALRIDTDAGLARWFGIQNRQAVSQWPDDAPIPELRQLQAARKRPDLWPATDVSAAA